MAWYATGIPCKPLYLFRQLIAGGSEFYSSELTAVGDFFMNRMGIKQASLCCLIAIAAIAIGACQRTDTTNTNVNTNLSANANLSPAANANVSPGELSSVASREPDQYRATLVLSAETEGGEKTVGIPTLTAEIARNGADRRVAFKLPDGSDLVYLEKGEQHMVLLPSRKQWAELTPESTGIQFQKLMTPGQLVGKLENLKGLQKVGEDTVNGRAAEKYRYTHTANTKTSAGEVNAEAFIFVDKETGLPLRSELFAEATGNVQGVKGAKIVAEMRDITSTVDTTWFEVPAGYSKVPPQQVRQQITALANMAGAVIQSLLGNMNAQANPAATVAPTASPSP